jgi:predicted alpha/beta hydrolase family esterase
MRLLIIPGLYGSEPAHWQSWLQARHPTSVRVNVLDWSVGQVDVWAERIAATLIAEAPGPWLAVAHSFGCLALARYAALGGRDIDAGLLVAPANPQRFNLAPAHIARPLPFRSNLVVSDNDHWMAREDALALGAQWGSRPVCIGPAGHINVDAGFGPWPLAQALVEELRDADRHAAAGVRARTSATHQTSKANARSAIAQTENA